MDVGLAQVQGWSVELEALCERIGPRFGRVGVRRRAGSFLRGLLAGVERKNGWQLAEYAGDHTPDGMQRLLNHARWDPDQVRDDLVGYVSEVLARHPHLSVARHRGVPGGSAPCYPPSSQLASRSRDGVNHRHAAPPERPEREGSSVSAGQMAGGGPART
jgi:hypothetical protein